MLDGIAVQTVADAEPDYVLEPIPRSDAVVLSEDGIAVRPVPLGLRAESPSNADGGINASPRSTSQFFGVIRPVAEA